MDSALGPPESMSERRAELTPMMAQYHDLCARYDDAIVLFQVGDFYETFGGAAETTARLLELTLTSREDSTGEYPMTGIPVDNAATYVEELLEAGYRVAIADQVEEPGESAGVVERAVTRVITPGTLTEDELLSSDDNNFVAAVAVGDGSGDTAGDATGDTNANADVALALLDVSTGDFLTTSASGPERIADEISRFVPSEAVLGPYAPDDILPERCMVTPFDPEAFDLERATDLLETYVARAEALVASDAEVRACGAVLAYAEYVRGGVEGVVDEADLGPGETDDGESTEHERQGDKNENENENEDGDGEEGDGDEDGDTSDDGRPRLEYLTRLRRYDPREYLLLDAVAVRSLELFEPRGVHGHEEATLVGVLDETASALGGRKLRDWLRRPLLEAQRIDDRLDAVEELYRDPRTREAIQDALTGVYDLERLIGRISRERANARDLRSLHDTLAVVPEIRGALEDAEAGRLKRIREALDPLEDVRRLIDRAIVSDPPHEITEGGIVADGYDARLDTLRETARDGKQWIDELEDRERERTGVDSLKVGYNSVHGYYIEVTNPNLEAVPADYQRRQTLKRSERFVTPELKEREDEIVGAESRADQREYDLFCRVRRDVGAEVERVQTLADALGTLDVLCSLATVAAERDYSRPEVLERGSGIDDDSGDGDNGDDDGDGGDGDNGDDSDDGSDGDNGDNGDDDIAPRIEIEAGRHPVVERTQESFVPNDARFDAEDRLAIITGPNMSGKSTYMRQIAQIVLLAQVGSFVPARGATLTPVERIFTRVGASDDIAGGRSTFMVEMDELATILQEADERSVVLLDEVGRGTSTSDGLAIARAITEHLHDEIGALTLFATHHHPLTKLADELEGAFTRHFETTQEGGDVTFDHEIAPGAAAGSYGVEVATSAGVPDPVVERARALVDDDDKGCEDDPVGSGTEEGSTAAPSDVESTPAPTVSSDGGDDPSDVASELRALDLAHLTPVEALTELDRLKRLLEE
ncbi:DNA mismatch repair protein MutS [Natronosalvus halobius]|uniref:DNA mismatch repair protein MutS n=1 Tax=Natronosalvus halobius TaxID=2953746 RepID=UPI0020A10E02|nr:DNA mismatch repair protein MutS [Natronosalvus halobius]USZ73201.1 DNA mismatch repair protein MutS [Natronosalvus halobius]